MIIIIKKERKMFHYADDYALTMTLLPKNWSVKSFSFQNILYPCIKN